LGKFIGWLIALALIAVVLYAIWSNLPGDVLHPFTPPPHP
jgi:hypothetical protein